MSIFSGNLTSTSFTQALLLNSGITRVFIVFVIKTGEVFILILFSIISELSLLFQSAEILYSRFSIFSGTTISQLINLEAPPAINTFCALFLTSIFSVFNSTLNQIVSLVLLNIFAPILEISQFLNTRGVLSSTITFFLTSIKLSEDPNKFFTELETTITLKFVRLSGKLNST